MPEQEVNGTTSYLEVRDARGLKRREDVESAPRIIGRSEDAQIQLSCETVSRRHAEIFLNEDGRCTLRDLGSNNGTRVNGCRVEEVTLTPGDRVEIGSYELRLIVPGFDGPSSASTMMAPLPMDDSTDSRISTLIDVASPKVDTTHLSILNRFAQRVRDVEDPQERMNMLCALMVRPEFHARSAIALRLDKGDRQRAPSLLCELHQSEDSPGGEPHLSRSLLAVVRTNETPALASQISSDPGAVRMTMVTGHEESAAIACPLRSTKSAMDVLYVVLPGEYGTGEWLTLVAHAAQTFQQAEAMRDAVRQREDKAAFERELVRASEIQRGLVPVEPNVEGLRVAIGFEPCRSVGGDYVDVLRTRDGSTMLAIADVCGKGLPAAMVASTIHSMMHTCRRAGVDLKGTMRTLNEHLCEYLDDRSFVTMACMVIDTATGVFEIVNAGHPAPAVVAPDGSISMLPSARNFPLGLMPTEMEAQQGTLATGHLLAFFTDGLTELTDQDGAELGSDRIADHIRDIYLDAGGVGADLDAMGARIEALLNDYLGDRAPGDDRTFLLACRE